MNKYGFSWVMMSLFFIFVSSCDDSDNQKNNNLNNQNLCVDNGTCGEHGVCDASLGVELCRCDTGWDGATCNACYPGYHDDGSGACVVDEQCLANTCSGHGACTLTGGVLSCTCVEGYTGTNCQDCAADFHLNAAGLCVADEVCADADPCGAHGTCVDTTGVIVCECAIGYTGTTCNACYPGYHDNGSGVCVLDEQCMPNTCSGHGTCTVTGGVLSCACALGYTGSNCQECAVDFHLNATGLCVADEVCADSDPCGAHGTCVDTTGVIVCECAIGYTGTTCNACYPGYHDNGSGVCVLDEQCMPNTCSGHGECTLTLGVVSCACAPGYTGSNCQECAADFHRNAENACVADVACPVGYCGDHGTCVDTTGVPVCTCAIGYTGTTCNACYPGYHDNGSGVCVLDEQCMPNTCSGNGVCTVTLGVVSCACAPGYSGSNCQDCAADFHLNAAGLCVADENCVDSDPCGAHGTCVDTTGIIVCECAIGHTGTTCESCYPGYEMCGDACVILWTDEEHCGACDNTCATGATCSAGACECNASTPCDGADFHGVTCGSLGFASGLLMCSPLCEIDTTGCIPRDYVSQNIGTLKYVPAGTFQRDATATNLSVVSVFRMSQYEITRAQWVAVTGWADPSNVTYSSGTNDPVQRVNWYDAIAFCNKLSIAEGRTQVYGVSGVDFSTLTYAAIPTSDNATWNAATANWSANGYRLPTEMEWMWAAMGADTENPGAVNTTGYANAFAGSTGTNAIGDYAVFGYNGSEVGRTTTMRSNPVGSKWANELGFHDLSGNVREWAWDWYGTYPSGTVTDYRGPASGANRVLRGGDWYYAASNCTVANQNNGGPSFQGINLGFRVVRP